MSESEPNKEDQSNPIEEQAPKWDYTNREQTLFIGALVVGLNLLVVVAVILDRTIPAVHAFVSGKPV